jgi:hypothetical protein
MTQSGHQLPHLITSFSGLEIDEKLEFCWRRIALRHRGDLFQNILVMEQAWTSELGSSHDVERRFI